MAKYLIVIWKWNLNWVDYYGVLERTTKNDFIDFIGEGNKRFEVKVEQKDNDEELKFIGFTKSNSFPNSNKYSDQDIIAECKAIFNGDNENVNQVLLLLHQGSNDNFNETRKNSILDNFKDKKFKARLFCGGTGKFYEDLVVENLTYFQKEAILNPMDKDKFQIRRDKFLSVWDWYWNKLELEILKKDIINLWLPLAIDIQGLSEVEDGKRKSYINEIIEDLSKNENGKSYVEKLNEDWAEVKKILLPEKNKEVLDKKYQLSDKEKEKVKFPLECEKDKNGNYKIIELNTLKGFIQENYKDKNNPNFLPNWLQAVVSVIDEKLKKNV